MGPQAALLKNHQRKARWDRQWAGMSTPGWPAAPEVLAQAKGPTLYRVFLFKCGSVPSEQDIHPINSYSLEGIYVQVF